MSAAMTMNGVSGDFTRISRDAGGARGEYIAAACEEQEARRTHLRYREQLRVPPSSKKLRMVEGTAWVTMGGLDYVLIGGDCISVSGRKGDAIISALGEEGIVIELS
jgi:hypothetical protein